MKHTLLGLYHALVASPIFATFALLIAPIRRMLNNEKDFFVLLTLALLIDLFIGMVKYIKLKKFCFKDLVTGLIVKVMVSYGGIILFLSFAVLEEGWASEWFTLVARFTVLLYPAGSAFANMYVITNGRFPPISFMKKLKSFEEIITPAAIIVDDYNDTQKSKS